MNRAVFEIVDYIRAHDGIADKAALSKQTQQKFELIKDRSVYYSSYCAIRFSSTRSNSFSNTVVALSTLQKYDELPFIVCQVTPIRNILYLANSTFLRKISHSSQDLRVDNIRGSINGSDIVRSFNDLPNEPEYFEDLFNIHAAIGFSENLPRLVEATNNIVPCGSKFSISNNTLESILNAPKRAAKFVQSSEYNRLQLDLDSRVSQVAERY